MLVALLAALPASAEPAAGPFSIDIGDDWFCASTFEKSVCQNNLTAGDLVTWNYPTGDSKHTVTQCADDTFTNCTVGWSSGLLDPGQSFQQAFSSAGTFYYRCDIHPDKMFGQLNVSAAPVPTATPTSAPAPPPPPSDGEPPSGGTVAGEQPPTTAQPPGTEPSPTTSPSGGPAAVTQATPQTDLPDTETRSPVTTPDAQSAEQTSSDDSNGGSALWLYALIGIGGGLVLLGGGTLTFSRYRHRLLRRD
jgi:hypothetical protein